MRPKSLLLALRCVGACSVLLLVAGSPAAAQTSPHVTIENPKNLPLEAARVQALFDLTRRLAAQKFKLKPGQMRDLRLRLVLGVRPEPGYRAEEDGSMSLFLPQWHDARFCFAVMFLTLNRVPPEKQTLAFLRDVLERMNRLAPVPVDRLRLEGEVSAAPRPELLGPAIPDRPREKSLRAPLRTNR